MGKAYTGKLKVVSDGALVVAVDIGMEMNRVYCIPTDGRSSKTFKFDNTMQGMDMLWDMIVIGEIGDFKKFKTRSEIMKLAGLDLHKIICMHE